MDEAKWLGCVAVAEHEGENADPEQLPTAGRSEEQAEPGGECVEPRRGQRHGAARDQAVLDDPRATRERRRRGVGAVGAAVRVGDIVDDVDAQVRADGGQQAEQPPAELEPAVVAGYGTREPDRDDRRGEEGQPSREEHGPESRQPGADPDLVQVGTPRGDALLGVLEERRLGLVPAGRPRRCDRDDAEADRRCAPDVDIAALVVADTRLRPDVAEDDAHLLARGRQDHLGHGSQHQLVRRRPRGEGRGDRRREAVGADEAQDAVGVGMSPANGLVDRERAH